MKNIYKWLLGGILVASLSYFINAISTIFFRELYSSTPELLKPLSNVWLTQILLGNFSSGLIYGLLLMALRKGIPGKGIAKGVFLGLMLWAITVPPLLITYNTYINVKLIMSWLATGLIATPLACVIIILIMGWGSEEEKPEENANK